MPIDSSQALQWNKLWLDDWNLSLDRAARQAEARFGTKPGLLGMIGRATLVRLQYKVSQQGTLVSHEQEHLRWAQWRNRPSYIDHIGWLEGMTIIEGPTSTADFFGFAAAGLNASERHGEEVWARAASRRVLSLRDALAHFASALDDTTYAGAHIEGPDSAWNWEGSDFLNMRNMLNQTGHEIGLQELYTKSVLVDLLSPSTWYSLTSVVNYVLSGDREIALRPWALGGLKFTAPHLGIQRHLSHDTVRFHTTFMPDSVQPVRLRVDLVTPPGRFDREGIGARLQLTRAVELLPRTYLAPYLGRRTSGPGGSGWEYGAELRTELDGVGLSGHLGHSQFGESPGWSASLQIRLQF